MLLSGNCSSKIGGLLGSDIDFKDVVCFIAAGTGTELLLLITCWFGSGQNVNTKLYCYLHLGWKPTTATTNFTKRTFWNYSLQSFFIMFVEIVEMKFCYVVLRTLS